MAERYLCVHGHFYQPPRENPWLEYLELQESARPFHDWNQRIQEECYGPNAAARILDEDGLIGAIHNNYSRINFNFGPTLLSWLEVYAPRTYAAVLEADQLSREHFGGHGSAIAQAYNHMIMPLANRRDRTTQVRWGLHDFEARFGRAPEGMWLPETAVDLDTLEILAAHGIAYTILAPHQALRTRPVSERDWQDVSGARIDPRRPYAVMLPSGRDIAVFFYDGPISRAVAFEGLLKDGVTFANRLVSVFSDDDSAEPQLAHVAVDGETFGHHHRYGEMALAYALHYIEENSLARISNYGQMLELHPPTWEVEIAENTSWSCSHGVERWRSNCGCSTGQYSDQSWREPLRSALDELRDELATIYEREAPALLRAPWGARDRYMTVVLDRSRANGDEFLHEEACRELNESEKGRALELLEMQRQAMLMYTSCGWFFDDVSRIETVQILCYAARAIQLAESVTGRPLAVGFVERLADARSNVQAHGNGRRVWESRVRPCVVDLPKVAAHYAIRSLFEPDRERGRVHCYQVEQVDLHSMRAGAAKLAVGRVEVTSEITRANRRVCVSALHFGDHTINGGAHDHTSEERYQQLIAETAEAFQVGDLATVVRLLDEHYGGLHYSMSTLFRDQQRRVLDLVMKPTLEEAGQRYRQLYERHAPLMRFLQQLGMPSPPALVAAGEVVLNTQLRAAFECDDLDLELIHRLLDEARSTAVSLDTEGIGYAASHTLERGMDALASRPGDLAAAQALRDAAATVRGLPFAVDLIAAQTIFYTDVLSTHVEYAARASRGDPHAEQWLAMIGALAEALGMSVPD